MNKKIVLMMLVAFAAQSFVGYALAGTTKRKRPVKKKKKMSPKQAAAAMRLANSAEKSKSPRAIRDFENATKGYNLDATLQKKREKIADLKIKLYEAKMRIAAYEGNTEKDVTNKNKEIENIKKQHETELKAKGVEIEKHKTSLDDEQKKHKRTAEEKEKATLEADLKGFELTKSKHKYKKAQSMAAKGAAEFSSFVDTKAEFKVVLPYFSASSTEVNLEQVGTYNGAANGAFVNSAVPLYGEFAKLVKETAKKVLPREDLVEVDYLYEYPDVVRIRKIAADALHGLLMTDAGNYDADPAHADYNSVKSVIASIMRSTQGNNIDDEDAAIATPWGDNVVGGVANAFGGAHAGGLNAGGADGIATAQDILKTYIYALMIIREARKVLPDATCTDLILNRRDANADRHTAFKLYETRTLATTAANASHLTADRLKAGLVASLSGFFGIKGSDAGHVPDHRVTIDSFNKESHLPDLFQTLRLKHASENVREAAKSAGFKLCKGFKFDDAAEIIKE